MTCPRWTSGLWTLMIALGGCVGRGETQFLGCAPRRPDVEARSYDWHDPFPDEDAGPGTASRPRSFVEPRSDTRKLFDLRFFEAHHPTAARGQLVHGSYPYGAPVAASPLPNYPYPGGQPPVAAAPVMLPY
ncbi:MAG TPA: hypothetical protein VM165_22060 [Planctomycetaceae bacterium]|nr:hypothetical protein [Planctomycetaceae bacterium]